MTHKIILTTIFLLLASWSQAQQSITSKQIKNTQWEQRTETTTGAYFKIEVDNTTFTSSFNKRVLDTYNWYLADFLTTEFESSKVGKPSEGKYIILKSTKTNKFFHLEITSMSNNLLKIRGLRMAYPISYRRVE